MLGARLSDHILNIERTPLAGIKLPDAGRNIGPKRAELFDIIN